MKKTKADLGWNEIRVTVHAIANLRARLARERALNRILPELQKKFEAHLAKTDTVMQLGPGELSMIEQILAEELDGVIG